jgi:hypothetical protein
MMIGLANVIGLFARPARWPLRAFATLVLIALLWRNVTFAREREVFDAREAESKYSFGGKFMGQVVDSNSVILALAHSGSMRYYSGRPTLRYDYLQEDWLDRAVEWLLKRGVHPYAMLEDSEVDDFKNKFSTQALGHLDQMSPMTAYANRGVTIYLYDLARPGSTWPSQVAVQSFRRTTCVPPAPPQGLVLKP